MPRVFVVACLWASLLVPSPARAQDGAALYAQRCASCHEGGQVARAPARDVIAALAADRIVAALETGTMRVQGETLTPEQRRAIGAYLSAARRRGDRATLRGGEPTASHRIRLARLGRHDRQ